MPATIKPDLKKIGDYLKLEENAIFIVPEYQRSYSWEIEQCDKLWQDISDYIQNGSQETYFFGTIIVNCQADDTEYWLIDGQQRTTTFMLLLKAMLIIINDKIIRIRNENPNEMDENIIGIFQALKARRRVILKLLYKAKDEKIFDEPNVRRDAEIYSSPSIFTNRSINEKYKDELYTILSAANFEEIQGKVIRIPFWQQDNKYTNFFKNFRFFYDKIQELDSTSLSLYSQTFLEKCELIEIKSWQVEQAIMMFNSLNSDGQPLSDADIISAKFYASADSNGKEGEFSDVWNELVELVGKLYNKKIVSMDSLLRQKMYYERAIGKEFQSASGAVDVTTPGVRRYYTHINRKLLDNPVGTAKDLLNLAKIWEKVCEYTSEKIMAKIEDNSSKFFLACYFCRYKENEIPKEELEILIECMMRLFTILLVVDAGYSNSNFKTFLFAESLKLSDPSIGIDEIKGDFDKHINKNWEKDDICAYILECNRNSMVHLNEYLLAKETGKELNLDVKYDIEHIMPDSGRNRAAIRNDANIDNEETFKEYVNKLGNKILLEENINRSIGNDWFVTKLSTSVKNKTGYIDSKFPAAGEIVEKYKDVSRPLWTKDDIDDATMVVAKRVTKFVFDS